MPDAPESDRVLAMAMNRELASVLISNPVSDVRRLEGRTVFTLRGDLDVHTAPAVRGAVGRVTDVEHHLVIDLRQATFMDATGLGALVWVLREVRALGGVLDLVCDQVRLLRTFGLVGLDEVFSIHPTLTAVLSSSARAAALASSEGHRGIPMSRPA